MKKSLFLITTAMGIGVLFSGCNSNDDAIGTVSGKWDLESYAAAVSGSPEYPYDGNEAGCSKDYYEFASGGILNEGDYYDELCSLDVFSGTWSQTGNKLHISNDAPQEYTILKLTDTTMKLKQEPDDSESVAVIYTFSKQQ